MDPISTKAHYEYVCYFFSLCITNFVISLGKQISNPANNFQIQQNLRHWIH